MSEFAGKTLVLSGGTRGIGRAIIDKFAQNGANIAFTFNNDEEGAKAIRADFESRYKIKCRCYRLDILEPESYKEVFEAIDADFNEVNYFISNAIISGRSVVGGFAPFMRLKAKGLNNIYTATVLAFVIGAQEAAKRMEKSGGGAIVAISSTGNLVHTENYAGHGTSKAALEIMVKYAANELASKNIRANVVSGGPIDTDALRKFPNYEEMKAGTIARTPLGRMGQATDLAGATLFLCSKDSYWITGQTLIADGGSSFT
ncbi:MAG: enoyl-ACP reductase [Helicobacteraceae bacterium]|jgi:7-alpha-hydroxysteroid dehydrogenase|nr:enoyl-ACP reductase [Helicobacteraceae bacterium]